MAQALTALRRGALVKTPISIVIPSLADRELLAMALTPVLDEVQGRALGDEVIVVDDSGSGALEEFLAHKFASVRCVKNSQNLGFGPALLAGVQAARCELFFAMNPDIRVGPGIFDCLTETLLAETLPGGVYAVSPYVLLPGKEAAAESLPELVQEGGFPVIRHRQLELTPGETHPDHPAGIPVAFALGGAMLMRRSDFLERPFDPLFEPFYWEDVDASQVALAAGRQVLCDPRAVVEHHLRGTIASRVPERVVRAAIEKNRLLFAWKHLADSDKRRQHFEALSTRVVEQALAEEREELIWLLLALEQLQAFDQAGQAIPIDRIVGPGTPR